MSNQVGLEKVEVARLQGVDEGGLLVGGRVGLAKVDVGEERGAVALTLYAFFFVRAAARGGHFDMLVGGGWVGRPCEG